MSREFFSANLYDLCRLDCRAEAIDLALNYFDDLLRARNLVECEKTLDELDENRLCSSVLVSILGITRLEKSRGRDEFFERSHKRIADLKGRKYAKDLLEKYR